MSKFSKYLVYSSYYPKRGMAVLAVTAAAVATLLLFPGPAMGISSNVDPDKSSYLLGEIIQFDGEIGLSDGETKQISSVTLTVNGSQGFTQALPTAVGNYSYPANDLSVIVTWSGVSYSSGYAYGYGYTGAGNAAKIEYAISWDPPYLLDPPPTYSLAPNTVAQFDIPQATPPSLPAGLPDELPTLSTGFDIPAVSEVDQNAPDPLPTLTALANAIPLKTAAVQGAPGDLTSNQEISDVAFEIPTVTDDLVAGVSSAPDSTVLVSTSDDIIGLARDGNGNVYALVDANPVDQIKKYDSSGAVVSAFGSSGVADVVDGNDTDITEAKGIAAAGDALWVTHAQGALDHQDGQGGPSKRWIQKFDLSDGSSGTECYLDRQGPEDATITPITGIGDYIWGFNEDSNHIARYDMTSNCSSKSRSKTSNLNYQVPVAIAASGGLLYTIQDDGSFSNHTTNDAGWTADSLSGTVTGYTSDIGGFQMDSDGVYYLASKSNGSAISKSQGSSSITTSPRGLAYDSTNSHFYLLVNGDGGNDRIIVTDTSGTQVGSSIDTGESTVEGITFEDGNIWAVFGGSNDDAKMKAYDIANTSWGSNVTLSVSNNQRDYRGIAYNGEYFFTMQGDQGNFDVLEDNGDSDTSGRCDSWQCSNVGSGIEAAAYHSTKGHYYVAKNDAVVALTTLNGNNTEEGVVYTDLDSATSLGGSGLKARGMVIIGSVIYFADDRNDAILKASLPTGETTSPTALTNDGTYLWAVTDGTAGADTLLKLNASTGAKEAAFTLDKDNVTGITYFDNALWILTSPSNGGCKLQKLDSADGSNVGSEVGIGDNNWCDGFGGLSNDGDDFFVMGSTNSQYKSFDDNGNEQSNKNIQNMSNGGKAVAINSTGQNWIGKDSKIDAFTPGQWDMEQIAGMEQNNLTVTGNEDLDVTGMTWMGSTLYIADDETDYIYKTSAPAGSNALLGMATDGTDLYLLVNNTPNDSIIKVDVDGNKDTNWGTSGVLDTNKSSANAVAVFNNQLWVAELEQGNMGSSWKFQGYNVSNGSAGDDFEYNQVPMGQSVVKGLASDGDSLIVGHTQMQGGGQGGLILFDDNGNDTGNNISLNDEYNSGVNSIAALAYRSQSPEILSALNDEITTYGSDGSYSNMFQTSVNEITGLAAIGHVVYVGDADSNKVLKAAVPLTQSQISTEGKAMAVDGDNMFIVVEASPRDYVIKVDTDGNFVTAFNSGGAAELPIDDVEGIEVLGGSLYAVNMASGSCPPNCGMAAGKLYKLNKSTAALEATYSMPEPCGSGPCYNGIGGLGLNADGDGLLVGVTKDCYMCGGTELFAWDPNNSNNWDSVYQQQAGSPSAVASANDFVYIGEGTKLHQFTEAQNNDLNHNKTDNLAINADVKGLAYVGTTMYLSVMDYQNNKGTVRGVTLNENIPELTIVGSYTTTLAASGDGFSTTDTSTSFSIAKATSSTVAVTSPTSGFSVFTKAMPITGTVNDPAVETVSVGVDLPFTELFKDAADDGSTSTGKMTATGMWNAACKTDNGEVKAESGSCSWYYGQTNNMNYDNGSQNSGTLQLKEAISIVSADVSFTFDTWWDTEPGLDYDRKLVQVSENGSSWTTVAAILGPWDIDQGTGNPWYTPNELNAVQQWLLVPQANMGGGGGGGNFDPYAMCPPDCGGQGPNNQGGGGGGALWEKVEIDLSAYVGKTIFIRFSFDTMDAWVNDMQGWFIDNIEIGGAGFDGTTAAVTPATSAQKANGIYGTWATTFNLAEGINKIKVNSTNPYDSSLTSAVEVEGFLDTTPPTITIDESNVTSPTNQPTVTVTGTIDDINFQEMKIKQTTVSGEKTIVTVKSLPADKTFSKVASLSEGVNTFTATTKDGAGLEASATLTVILDTTGPVLTVNTPSYPLGAQSGRQGDVVIFSVDASSTGSAVDRLEVTYPGNGGTQRFKPANDIPEAIRDLWAVDGDFILATKIPDNASPGNYGLTVKAYDKAGNSSTKTIEAQVVSSLEAFNINLMPNWNLVSLPLMPDNGAISSMTNGVSGIDSVWYYDATSTAADPADRWLVYTASSQDVDTLSTFSTGRGYWFKMDPSAFTLSAALAPGLPQTPKAIKMTYTGQFVEPGTLPPSYAVNTGWNAMGFHSENDLPVTTALQSLESPQRIWGSLLQYNNRIVFEIPNDPTEEPTFEILLGAFERLLSTSDLTPGYGYWIYMVEDGVITP